VAEINILSFYTAFIDILKVLSILELLDGEPDDFIKACLIEFGGAGE